MKKLILMMGVLSLVVACSANTSDDGTEDPDDGVEIPDGTTDPDADNSIQRYEDAEANNISYDAATDTFSVNNLPFDGVGTYDRDDQVASLGAFSVYENNNVDPTREYKAIYQESASGRTKLAIVRTGSYLGYGFGGYVYERDGGVVLPSDGQAIFNGDYAGMRVFSGQSGLQYTTADAELEVDFSDFDSTGAVEGTLTNRVVFDEAGNALGTLPTLIFATGSITDAGEITGTAGSYLAGESFENGTYYAIIAGPDADEIVGVVVVEATDPNDDEISIQETGGFIVTESP